SVWTGWRRLVRSTPTSCLIWPDATPCRMVAWIWSSTWTGGGEAEASTDVEVASAEGSGCEADRATPAGRELATCAEGVADVPVVWAAGEVRNWVSTTAATAIPVAAAAPKASTRPRPRPTIAMRSRGVRRAAGPVRARRPRPGPLPRPDRPAEPGPPLTPGRPPPLTLGRPEVPSGRPERGQVRRHRVGGGVGHRRRAGRPGRGNAAEAGDEQHAQRVHVRGRGGRPAAEALGRRIGQHTLEPLVRRPLTQDGQAEVG